MTAMAAHRIATFVLLLVAGRAPANPNGEHDLDATRPSPGVVERARFQVDEMQRSMRDVIALQGEARKAKDIIRLNCVNDKAAQIKRALALAQESLATLTALGERRAEQEPVRIGILH